jgi:ElaB/YqjD/DUF883 family membrane-anchored ribosome-binding protein
MSADSQLQDAYKEWRRLAETEGEAIRTRNWLLVADCQKALQQLQPRILHHTQEAQEQWARVGLDRAAKEKNVRAVVAKLIEIESRNNELLDAAKREAQAQLGQLEKAGRMLRQVQRFYAPSRPPAWTSFS